MRRFLPLLPSAGPEETITTANIVESVEQTPLVGAGGGVTTANPILPSVTGFATNKFTGAATVSYPIALPPGPGGFAPSLGLSYSSGSVADGYNGVKDWEGEYYHQASWVGLGWEVGGLGYIVRDPGSWRDPQVPEPEGDSEGGIKDDRFYLVFPGGAAELVNKAKYEERNKQWETEPQLFLKIKHEHKPYGAQQVGADTAPWEITSRDGIKYYFGSPLLYDERERTNGHLCEDESCHYVFPTKIDGVSSDGDGDAIAGHSLATQIGRAYKKQVNKACNRLLAQKWMLRKIVDTHGNTIEIKYEPRVKKVHREIDSTYCPSSWCPNYYVHDLAPKQIIYSNGHATVDFIRERRDDYQIEKYNDKYHVNFWSKRRLKEIQVKVDGRIARKYVLDYGQEAWRCKGNEEFHSLLTSITSFGIDGAQALPPYTFTYYNDYSSKERGCPGDDYPRNNHFSNVLLKTADNGYGGKVTFEYDSVIPPVCLGSTSSGCESGGWCCIDGGEAAKYGSYRARAIKKIVEDGMENSYQVTYDYSDGGKAFVKSQIDGTKKIPYTGYRFLGYGQVDERLYALNDPGKVESLTKTYYYDQLNDGWDGGSDDIYNCFRPDPRAGTAKRIEAWGSEKLSETEAKLQIREGSRELGVSPSCSQISSSAAYFVSPKETTQTLGGKTSKVEYGPYDNYGNLLRTIYWGDVADGGGEGNFRDERTLHIKYYPNETKWILNRPAWINTYKGVVRDDIGGENWVTQVLNYYDGATKWDTLPQVGDLTKIETGKPGETSAQGCTIFGRIPTRFEYDSFGNQTKAIDPLENEAETVYDEVYKTYPVDTYNALEHHTHTEYNFVKGVPTEITDPNGKVTNVYYDDFGRRTKVLQPEVSTSTRRFDRPEVRFTYFDRRERNAPASVFTEVKKDDGTFMPSIVHYNGLGQQIQGQSPWEGSNIVVSNTSYNSLGKADKASLPYDIAGGVGNLRAPDWGKPFAQSFYDSLGRVVKVKNPDGTEVSSEYSGWTVVSFDAENHKTLVESDAYGQAVKVQTFEGGEGSGVYTTTTSEYDILGNVVKTTTEGHSVTASYDSHSWKTWSDDPDLGRYRYCYDKNGNLSWQKDPKNQVINFPEYDALNRLAKKTLPDGSYVSYFYDAKGEIGWLSHREDFDSGGKRTGRAVYFHDELGRVVRVGKEILGENFATHFAYNLLGNLNRITYPDREMVENIYDSLGRLDQVIGDDVYVSDIAYTPQGEMKTIALGDGTKTSYGYYPENRRLESISSPVLNYSYTYYDAGNIKTWSGFESGEDLTFKYDHLYRLKSATGLYEASYDYDKLGRMFTKQEDESLSIGFDSGFPLHAPKNVGGVSFQYDDSGNLLSDGRRTIEWDAENKPTRVEIEAPETAGPIRSPTSEPEPEPVSPEPAPKKSPFGELLGKATDKIVRLKQLLRRMFFAERGDEFDLNGDGVVNSIDFLMLSLDREGAPEAAAPAVAQTYITDYTYDGDGVRVLRQVTVKEDGGEEVKEKKLYVNKYFAKDLLTGEIEKYYFAGGKRVAQRVTPPICADLCSEYSAFTCVDAYPPSDPCSHMPYCTDWNNMCNYNCYFTDEQADCEFDEWCMCFDEDPCVCGVDQCTAEGCVTSD